MAHRAPRRRPTWVMRLIRYLRYRSARARDELHRNYKLPWSLRLTGWHVATSQFNPTVLANGNEHRGRDLFAEGLIFDRRVRRFVRIFRPKPSLLDD